MTFVAVFDGESEEPRALPPAHHRRAASRHRCAAQFHFRAAARPCLSSLPTTHFVFAAHPSTAYFYTHCTMSFNSANEHEEALRLANEKVTAQAEALRQANSKIAAQEKEIDSLKALIAGQLATLQKEVNSAERKEEFKAIREELQATRAEYCDHIEKQQQHLERTAEFNAQLTADLTRALLQVRRYQFREGIVEEALTDFTRDLEAAVYGGSSSVNDLVVRFRALMERVKEAWSVMRGCCGEAS